MKRNIQITDRDLAILHLVHKFRFCLGRHIKVLAHFQGARATDRRLKLLVENNFLERKKYLYGVPYLYTLTHKSKLYIGENKRKEKLRIDRIAHDISVLEVVIFYIKKYGITLNEILTEKDLRSKAGFGVRKHYPDFVATIGEEKHAVEIEINAKSKERLRGNIGENYLNYDYQIWFTDNAKVKRDLQEFQKEYPNLQIYNLSEVKQYVAVLFE